MSSGPSALTIGCPVHIHSARNADRLGHPAQGSLSACCLTPFPTNRWRWVPRAYQALVHKLREADLGGGLTYDAVTAATAAENGSRLLTADRRAVPIYALMGADFELVS